MPTETKQSNYQNLVEGELGFELVQRFKHDPTFLGLRFRDDGAEPSFLGYDHPAVLIFRRQDRSDQVWAAWRRELEEEPCCADGAAQQVADAFRRGDLALARGLIQGLHTRYPDMRATAYIEVYVYRLLGSDREQAARRRYARGYADRGHTAYLLPWATALSLGELGLKELALGVLQDGVKMPFPSDQRPAVAWWYARLGDYFYHREEPDYAGEVYRMSTQFHAVPEVCNTLADMAHEAGHRDEALAWWAQSLALDDAQPEVHSKVGELACEQRDYARALLHLEKAADLDPGLSAELEDWISLAQKGARGS